MLCGCHDYLFPFNRSRNNSGVKALHRLCGQRGAYDSKRANKCPLILCLGKFDFYPKRSYASRSNFFREFNLPLALIKDTPFSGVICALTSGETEVNRITSDPLQIGKKRRAILG